LIIYTRLAFNVSATDIRAHLREQVSQRLALAGGEQQGEAASHVPTAVWDYILQHHLYHR
jgi:nicotinate-nucleotide adenylyltransferase